MSQSSYSTNSKNESIEGFVVDVACIRHWPQKEVELMQRAAEHTKNCALMGHCIESGYGIIDDQGKLMILDAKATIRIVDALENSNKKSGIKLKVEREMKDKEMQTVKVTEISS